jgi:hypothetical protein
VYKNQLHQITFLVVYYVRHKSSRQEQQKYTVLLLLTDGVINDEEATIASIVQASNQPLSIVIVGVGAADFSGQGFVNS